MVRDQCDDHPIKLVAAVPYLSASELLFYSINPEIYQCSKVSVIRCCIIYEVFVDESDTVINVDSAILFSLELYLKLGYIHLIQLRWP